MRETSIVGVKDLTLVSTVTQQVLLNKVSLHIEHGERVALLGGSGSGKTLLASVMSGVLAWRSLEIQKGFIYVKGRSISNMSTKDLNALRQKSIRMIMQDPVATLNPLHTAATHIIESLRMVYKDRSPSDLHKKAQELLEEVGFSDPDRVLTKYPHSLSGGECQRVCIAAALACEPDLLIADEPCSSLDPIAAAHIMELLTSLSAKHNTALLFISHNVNHIQKYAQRLYVMRDGYIIDALSTKKLLKSPTPYTQRLIGALEHPLMPNVPSDKDPIIVANNLSVRYKDSGFRQGEKLGISDVSLKVFPASVLGVCGPSGSGKSTLAMHVARLVSGEGEMSFFGHPLNSKTHKQDQFFFRRSVQLILQSASTSLNPHKSVFENLAEPARYYSLYDPAVLKERVIEALSWVRLSSGVLQTDMKKISGGEAQRIAFARTLLLQPKVLILDEPTSALDLLAKERMLSLLEYVRDQMDMAIVLISHDINVMRRMANYMIFLENGVVIEEGHAQSVFANPKTKLVKQLLKV
ncbi:MAG: ATP-binding cassette domain-containing protein [Alphaproteobacteria bacterium]|nr:ATP-binding cassette domain-containing protein [Alphaproteobacteria bacterium]